MHTMAHVFTLGCRLDGAAWYTNSSAPPLARSRRPQLTLGEQDTLQTGQQSVTGLTHTNKQAHTRPT